MNRPTDIETLPLPPGAVLIVGAGIAGLFTALKLKRPAVVISASPIGRGASSVWAQGGLAAAVGEGDSPAFHVADTIAAGAGLVDEAAATVMAEAAADRLADLEQLGAAFDKTPDGRYAVGREAAHGRNRIVHAAGDRAGAAIMAALIEAAEAADHITLWDGLAAEDFLIANGSVTGVLAAKVGQNARVLIPAAKTVLATGGIGGLYAVTTNPRHAQGHGLTMAARAGAVLRDLEFVQFHPTALDVGADPAPLATEALRGTGAQMLDGDGVRFMTALHGDAELGPRDIVARGVARAIKETGAAYLDARDAVGASFPDAFPTVFAACEKAGIDPRRDLMPIAPAVHYHMGGVKTDLDGRTTVPGLWAVGEVASSGVHGANRLASNSLLEAVVFGDRIASALNDMETDAPGETAPPEDRLGLAPKPASPDDIAPLRRAMAKDAGLLRSAGGLESVRALAEETAARATTSGLFNAALAADLIARAALQRQESRGGHAREDFPDIGPGPARHSDIRLAVRTSLEVA